MLAPVATVAAALVAAGTSFVAASLARRPQRQQAKLQVDLDQRLAALRDSLERERTLVIASAPLWRAVDASRMCGSASSLLRMDMRAKSRHEEVARRAYNVLFPRLSVARFGAADNVPNRTDERWLGRSEVVGTLAIVVGKPSRLTTCPTRTSRSAKRASTS
jgi:hypothetical protein